ncbi:MAG: abortive infection system antitoxin AbiGi family protein [Acinetobacter johnsonii]
MYNEFFYHSFSRLLKNESTQDNNKRAFQTLESILKNGLLFVPEEIKLPFKIESPLKPIVQHRVCFTLISREKLLEHTKIFGNFSIEFNTNILREIGITPAMYLPIFNYDNDRHLQNVSSKFVYRLMKFHQEAREEAEKIHNDLMKASKVSDYSKILSLKQKKQEILEKRAWFEGLANMIYPLDNNSYTQENGYYQQREWKLPANLTNNGSDTTEIATHEQQQELLDINRNFFSKEIDYLGRKLSRAMISFFLKTFQQKHILEHANKIIVPKENVAQVRALLSKYRVHLNVEQL